MGNAIVPRGGRTSSPLLQTTSFAFICTLKKIGELFPFHPLNLKIALLLNEERARFADDLLSYYNFCCGFLKKTKFPPPKKFKPPVLKKNVQNKKKKEKRDGQVLFEV